MTLDEAKAVAFAGQHATTTFDLAAAVIRTEGRGRDDAAYAQLADLKATLQRVTDRFECDDRPFECGIYVTFPDDTPDRWLFNCATREGAQRWMDANDDLLDAGNSYAIGEAVQI